MNHRTRIVASVVAALAAASVALGADGTGKGQDDKGAGARRHARILERFDGDRDGTLSADERAAARAALVARRAEVRAKVRAKAIERFDINRDGALDDAERAAARALIKARVQERLEGAGKDGRHGKHHKFLRGSKIRRALRAGGA